MTEAAAFWDRRADKYSRSPIRDQAAYEKTLERTRAHLVAEDQVLEVGCGTGTTALLLAPSVRRILATDVSSRMIEIASEKAADEGASNVRFAVGTIFDEKLEPGSFDVVMAFNLLHLLHDLPGVVGRVHSLLEPGGRFISKSVCLGEARDLPFRLLIRVMHGLRLAPHVSFVSPGELDGIIASAGFEILETGSYPQARNRFLVAQKT